MAHALIDVLSVFIDALSSWKTNLLEQWPTITQGLQTNIVLEKIDNDRLIISVGSSAWLQEMYFFSDILLAKINTTLDKPRIKKLHFKYKSLQTQRVTYKKRSSEAQLVTVCLSVDQQKLLKSVPDEELQECLRLFLIRCKSKEYNELLFSNTSRNYISEQRRSD